MSTNKIFEKYGDDPIQLCNTWLQDAEKQELNDPEAICLATCDANGNPSNRMVLIKDITEKGFKFHTNSNSHKGQDIAQNPKAAMCFYWKSLRKQIRIEGTIEQISAAESDKYFTTRPIKRQIGAWASDQSAPFDDWSEIKARQKHFEEKFANVKTIPRPEYWNGYRLIPNTIEFWLAHRDRLHTRFIYKKTDNSWNANWLYP